MVMVGNWPRGFPSKWLMRSYVENLLELNASPGNVVSEAQELGPLCLAVQGGEQC